jgi:hypothetical protein
VSYRQTGLDRELLDLAARAQRGYREAKAHRDKAIRLAAEANKQAAVARAVGLSQPAISKIVTSAAVMRGQT